MKNIIEIKNKKCKKYNYLTSYKVQANLDLLSICVDDVFNSLECIKLIEVSENVGYEKASLFDAKGKKIFYTDVRDGLRCIIDDSDFSITLEQRIQHLIPLEYRGKKYHSINPRFRFLKYNEPTHHFAPHQDGCYSANNIMSMITILIYLNDDYAGARTCTNKDKKTIMSEIEPKSGLVYMMDQDILHSVPNLISGTKYVIRTELMYLIN